MKGVGWDALYPTAQSDAMHIQDVSVAKDGKSADVTVTDTGRQGYPHMKNVPSSPGNQKWQLNLEKNDQVDSPPIVSGKVRVTTKLVIIVAIASALQGALPLPSDPQF